MPSFVHTADIHLDTPFSARFTQKQMQLRRKELMQTFQTIVRAAEKKDFLFISGDLFDGEFVSLETVSFLQRAFSEIPDTEIFIAAGNHDPYTETSPYRTVAWGGNVHIFSTKMEYFDFPEKKTRIHGVSFSESRQETPMLKNLSVAPDWCNIAVVHGEVVTAGTESVYHPITKQDIASSGADYIALGHIHRKSEPQRCQNTWYAYPGIPEGRGFDETGDCGYYEGEAEKGSVSLTWIPCCRRRFWDIAPDISKIRDSVALEEALRTAMKECGGRDDCYQIRLTGSGDFSWINTDLLEEACKDSAFYLSVKNEIKIGDAIEDVMREHSLRGDFAAAMLARIEQMPDGEKEVGYLALRIGLGAMGGGSKE